MLASVIIPTFDRVGLLSDAIRSSLNQRGVSGLEVIVVDDGSSDETRSCVADAQKRDPRLKYIYQENRGPSAARNTGLRYATGEFVQFLDSDDLLLPDKIARQILAFDGGAGAGVESCHCITEYIREDGIRAGVYGASQAPHADISAAFLRTSAFASNSALYRRAACLAIGGWDEDLRRSEDWEFNFRIGLLGGRHVFVPETLALVRTHMLTRQSTDRIEQGADDYLRYLRALARDLSTCRPERADLRRLLWFRCLYGARLSLSRGAANVAQRCLQLASEVGPRPLTMLSSLLYRIAACGHNAPLNSMLIAASRMRKYSRASDRGRT